jgi:acetoacetate decarboxylase
MTLQGYTVPRTPRGLAGLVPPPPWHYVADFLVVDFHADPTAAASLLPEGLEPHPDAGRCAAVYADWQSCSETGDELLDPVRSHYREFYIVVSGLLDGEEVTTCAFIWVDQDFALARGWIQGFPKKLGSIHMTRSFGLDCKAEGTTFAGTVAAYDRRLAMGTVTPTEVTEQGPTHNDPPLINRRHFPRLAAGRHGDPAVHELVRAKSRDRAISAIHRGPATLELYPAPNEEHVALAPVRMGSGFRFQFAYTVDDLETVKEL